MNHHGERYDDHRSFSDDAPDGTDRTDGRGASTDMDGRHDPRGTGQGGPDPSERTFAPLPPPPGRGFAQTWWGRTWVKALEETALDSGQLTKGRKNARAGAVGAVSVRPGRITAVVRDRDGTGHRCDVLLQELTDAAWDRFLDMAVDRAGHIAALLDREMPTHLVEDAATAGVELLPGIGDLEPECGCGAWDLCPHTAALCYQVARLLDQDPFVLLLLRGRGERVLLDDLQARSVALASAGAPRDGQREQSHEGVRADEVFAAQDALPRLPDPPPLPDKTGLAPVLDSEIDPGSGIDAAALEFLAADAAARAHHLLAQALSPGHARQPLSARTDLDVDAVRLAASEPGPVITGRLAAGTGRQRVELELAVRAWQAGGPAALAVLDDAWTPDAELLARATAVLDGAWEDMDRPRLRSAGAGRWTVVGAERQLRIGADGRWWPFHKEKGRWVLSGAGGLAPDAVLSEVLPGVAGELD
ncbi:SWF or SNF family helicase [Streptomyces sp. NPDC056500]|uniref:SWIM zinc finger family protein n=1 Tax=Streptomyces sp. NPDC056500 TaxID=3345840 RepID=UPI0036870DDD